MTKSIFSVMALLLLMTGTSAMADDNKAFMKLFNYELQNRAFALMAMENSVVSRKGEADETFWQAYLALERLNQKKFAPYAEKYGTTMEATFYTKLRTSLGGFVGGLFPETAMKAMTKATIKYVAKLEELETLAPQEDKAFFRYVVLQEQAQADAMVLFTEQKIEQAAAVLAGFVAVNSGI